VTFDPVYVTFILKKVTFYDALAINPVIAVSDNNVVGQPG